MINKHENIRPAHVHDHKEVESVFYFCPTVQEYESLWDANEISTRTITLIIEDRSIRRNGVKYGTMDEDMFLLMLNRALEQIKANKQKFGVIQLGDYLKIAADGTTTVDVNTLLTDNTLLNFLNNYFKQHPTVLPIATTSSLGVVMVGKGLAIDTNGILSVKINDPSDPDSDIENIIYNLFQDSSKLWARKDRYGVVKIGDGIDVNDGIISVNQSTINHPSLSVYNLDLQNNKLYLYQNNNLQSPINVDLSGLITSSYSNIQFKVENGHLYYWNGTTWVDLGVVKGDKGDKGDTGEKGEKGDTGATGADGHDGLDGQDGKDGKDGDIADITQIVNNVINEVKNEITEENNYWNSWVSDQINIAISTLAEDLKNNWNEIQHTSGWVDALNAYLLKIGLITVTDNPNGTTTIVDKYSILEQTLQSIQTQVASIKAFFDENGNLLSLEEAMSGLLSSVTESEAFMLAINSYISTNFGDVAEIRSAITSLEQRASGTDGALEAVSKMTTRVDNGHNITLNLLKSISNEKEASTSISSSYSIYETDEYGNYVYETVDGDPVWELDANGHAIPWTTLQLWYVKEDGTLTQEKSLGRNKKNTKLVDGEWITENVLDENNLPVKDRIGRIAYFAADPETGDYSPTIYGYQDTMFKGGEPSYGNDSIFLEGYSAYSVAYHRVRKMRTIGLSDLKLSATENEALSSLISNYESILGTSSTAAEALNIANANGANISHLASGLFYETKEENGVVKFHWTNGTNTVWSSESPGEGYSKIVDTNATAGIYAEIDNKTSKASLMSALDGEYAYVDTVVTKDNNGFIDSSIKLHADSIVLDGTTFAEDLFASSANVSKKLIVGEVGLTGITVTPHDGGWGSFQVGTLYRTQSGEIYTTGALITDELPADVLTSGATISPEVGGGTGGVVFTIRLGINGVHEYVSIYGGRISVYRGSNHAPDNLMFDISLNENNGGYELMTRNLTNSNIYTKIYPGGIKVNNGSGERTL